ncbi:TPA: M20 family peptidase, partial [Candidatus Bipolaricaulota bacterium]|nr:M20 family peptidase [Candidatus Bipolaricaulota bacterium]
MIGRELEELLVELVRIPSPNPPGGEAEMADFVADYLQGAGLEVNRVPLTPGRESVVGRLPGRGAGGIVL